MSRFQSAAALTAVALIAYSFGTSNVPPKQAQAAPVVVPDYSEWQGTVDALTAELAMVRESTRAEILRLEESLAVAKAAPKSTCLGGLCESCQCPGDGRCAKGECLSSDKNSDKVSEPQVAYRRVWVSTGRRRGYWADQAYVVNQQAGGVCVSCR